MSAQLEPRRFNVTEYYQMAKAGVLKPDDRVELIEGEIIKMRPIGSPHAACVSRLNSYFHELARLKAMISIQNPVRLDDFSEPVPDVALLKRREDFYSAYHPTPEDVLLIVEVSDSTILTDLNVKVPLYARAEIPEVWLVNPPKQVIEVYSEPAEGKYQKAVTFNPGEVLASPTVANLSLRVEEIIG